MSYYKGKTVFITGASRGIGLAIGLRLAREGANIAVVGKTAEPHPKLPGTVYSACEDIERSGGKALPLIADVRSEELMSAAVDKTVETFGGIDILINNASAISLTPTAHTDMKRYDLMHTINVRGTFLTSKLCIPHLKKSANPHILNMSPPLSLDTKWFAHHVAYTMSKYGMSMCVLGMSEEFRRDGIAVNALWPRTAIATAAVQNLLGGDQMVKQSRWPAIVGDATFFILQRNSRENTGQFYIDEEVLQSEGVTDFSHYAVDPTQPLVHDFFLE